MRLQQPSKLFCTANGACILEDRVLLGNLAMMLTFWITETREDYPRLRQQWQDEFSDVVNGVPEKVPPLRAVNHEIHLIDDNKVYKYHTPRCPDSLKEQLRAKVNRYIDAGWWEPCQVYQAAPMLCFPKRDGTLRTALDARQRNNNTIKDRSTILLVS